MAKERFLIFIGLIIAAFASIGILIPKYGIQDSVKIDGEERACAIRDIYQMLDNPIERSIVFHDFRPFESYIDLT